MKWISVEDRLPEPEEPVLVLAPDKHKYPFIGALYWEVCSRIIEPRFRFSLYWGNCDDDGVNLESSVTHWKPLQ